MLDFPNSPTTNQVFAAPNGTTWIWTGTKWASTGSTGYLALSGGTMTGDIVLARNADQPLEPTTLQQVGGLLANRNKIINGDMRIDQRNAGIGGTAQPAYAADRWKYAAAQASKGTWQQGTTGPALTALGFQNYLSFTSSSAYAVAAGDYFMFQQFIEAANVSESAWGTASATPATLSFWANASIAGTYGGSIRNSANNRSYPFSFALAASTWTYVTIPIPGDTTGTWLLSGNGIGITVTFSLGAGATYSAPAGAWAAGNFVSANGCVSVVGTNGAVFSITGVQFEFNPVATPFERRSMGAELALCQRYYEKGYQQSLTPGTVGGSAVNGMSIQYIAGLPSAGYNAATTVPFKTTKRGVPTVTMYSPNTGVSGKARDNVANADVVVSAAANGDTAFYWSAGMTAAGTTIYLTAQWAADAEL